MDVFTVVYNIIYKYSNISYITYKIKITTIIRINRIIYAKYLYKALVLIKYYNQ